MTILPLSRIAFMTSFPTRRRAGALLAVAVLVACSGVDDAAPSGDSGDLAAPGLGPLDPIDGPGWDPERIAVGDLAPDFRLESYRGDTLQLTDYRGEREVILAFYRGSW